VREGPQSWHYGLVAQWWAEFNEGGREIDYFGRFIERDGQPALDVACGTGRLLLPYVRAGLDVDGCDVSADMRAYMWRDGDLLAEEGHRITINLYFRNELLLMLERAGFVDVVVHGDHEEQEATPDRDFLVFVAKKRSST
jgi:SAM-dependent methyltransferase